MLASMLEHLDFASPSGKPVSGLVATANGENKVKRLDERLAVRDAIAIRDVDYVLFRRYSDDRSSQVVAYVVDNSDNHLSETALAELHKRVWLHGAAPLIYIAWSTRVDILSCARGPDFWHDGAYEYTPADRIEHAIQNASIVNQSLQARYSAWRLIDGTFWDDPRNSALAKSKERAHERLIAAVVETDEALNGDENPLLRRLLLLTVLIKYLEDRRVFPTNWFAGFCKGAKSFFEALRDGEPAETVRLLSNLEKRFNGDIFSITDEAAKAMSKPVLKSFADLVEAKTINRQRYLWEQFSFEHIPVEIVSHLYQRFVKGGHGTVYTPPFLASLLLDHVMPYDKITGHERILDPACGSGVFLVGAFRRLVNFLRAKSGWHSLDVKTLKKIVGKSIFGIELDSGAVDLTSFSLALAVCDALKPEVIWHELKFDSLRGHNLCEGDFFSEIRKMSCNESSIIGDGFDIVLGNPPFESDLTTAGAALNAEASRHRGTLPDKQSAYLFLEQGIKCLKPHGRLCLIQPSGILHNKNAFKFRQRVIGSAKIEAIFDFTSIRNLYEAADTKTVAFSIVSDKPDKRHTISHLTFRRTFGTHERLGFEIDHYDWHRVPQGTALDDPYIWRVNMLGGGRLAGLSQRLRKMRKLNELLIENDLSFKEGFMLGGNSTENSFLTGMPYLPPEGLTEDGIDRQQIGKVIDTQFLRPRTEAIYQPPLLLIRKNERLQSGYWDEGPLAFTSTLIGISGSAAQRTLIKQIAGQLHQHHRTYMLACMMHGSKAFVTKATAVLKQDISALPFPADPDDLRMSFWEQALEEDTVDHFSDFVRLGQNSLLLRQAATNNELRQYSALFCRMLGSVYANLQSSPPIFFDGLICQAFYFGDEPSKVLHKANQAEDLKRLVYHHHHESLRTVRMLRFYTDNVMLIVKPDRLRFWIRSTAIRDADETIMTLKEQGY